MKSIEDMDLSTLSQGLDEAMKELAPEKMAAFKTLALECSKDERAIIVRGLRMIAARFDVMRVTMALMASEIEAAP